MMSVVRTDDSDGSESGLESMRIKLAVMKAKEHELEHDNMSSKLDAISKLDSDLQEIQRLESFSKPNLKPVSKVVLTKKPAVGPTMKKSGVSGISGQIESQVEAIVACFTKIFEALVVKLEEPKKSEENPLMVKKSKEFETRFQRQLFEAKQKVKVSEGIIF